MRHYDEHTLELHVLGAASVAAQGHAIEAHLAECEGCRSMAAELRSFHAEVAASIETEGQAEAGVEVGEIRHAPTVGQDGDDIRRELAEGRAVS